jgi:UDP-N-acetylmuramoylalanine-D-glutamate ligase
VRIEDVKVITVIGAGNMGHQIGTLCALHGFETYITDTNSAQLKKAQDFVASYLPGRVEKGRISQETAEYSAIPGILPPPDDTGSRASLERHCPEYSRASSNSAPIKTR